jgi:hypothetical protein
MYGPGPAEPVVDSNRSPTDLPTNPLRIADLSLACLNHGFGTYARR